MKHERAENGRKEPNGVTQSIHVSKSIVRPPLRRWRNRDCHEFRFDEWFSHTFSRRLERANPFMRERKDNNFLRTTRVPRRKTHDDKLFFSGYVMARCTVCYSTEIKSDLGCAASRECVSQSTVTSSAGTNRIIRL